MKLIVDSWRVTETCQNGNERTFIKKVYHKPFFIDDAGNKRFNCPERRHYYSKQALKAQHLYHLEFVDSASTDLMILE